MAKAKGPRYSAGQVAQIRTRAGVSKAEFNRRIGSGDTWFYNNVDSKQGTDKVTLDSTKRIRAAFKEVTEDFLSPEQRKFLDNMPVPLPKKSKNRSKPVEIKFKAEISDNALANKVKRALWGKRGTMEYTLNEDLFQEIVSETKRIFKEHKGE